MLQDENKIIEKWNKWINGENFAKMVKDIKYLKKIF